MKKTDNEHPTISVIMPVYNSEKYLREAINSILCQTFKDFELIIINDGSADNSRSIIQEFQKQDTRIKLIENEKNLGISRSLNLGIDHAVGKYIARMDSDDISIKSRFSNQVKILELNPEIGFLGSSGYYIDENGKKISFYKVPTSFLEIKWGSLLCSPFIHPSVMIRKELFEKTNIRYDDTKLYVEDYDLWSKFINITKAINLKEPLIKYRIYSQFINKQKNNIQQENTLKIACKNILKETKDINLSCQEIIEILLLINNHNFFNDDLNKIKIRAINNLIMIFEYFINQNYGEINEIQELKKEFSIILSRKLFRLPLPKGYIKVIPKLNNINKFWLFDYLINMPSVFPLFLLFNSLYVFPGIIL